MTERARAEMVSPRFASRAGPGAERRGDRRSQCRSTCGVNCAHYILGPFGPPCALCTASERIAARGGKPAKKRAVIAVACKLAVTLLALWKCGADYRPRPEPQPLPQAA